MSRPPAIQSVEIANYESRAAVVDLWWLGEHGPSGERVGFLVRRIPVAGIFELVGARDHMRARLVFDELVAKERKSEPRIRIDPGGA